MASKKIGWWECDRIADEISEKAFEHLIDPLQHKLQEGVRTVWQTSTCAEQLSWMIKHGLAESSNDAETSVLLVPQSYTVDLCVGVQLVLGVRFHSSVRVFSDDAYGKLIGDYEALQQLFVRRGELATQLRKQLSGKTTLQACKAWPEAEDIIRRITKEGKSSDFTVPLESLLAKFLPLQLTTKGEENGSSS